MLRTRIRPESSRSLMKFAVAWISIAEGPTGMMMQSVLDSISWRRRPDAPAGASMINWLGPPGTCISTGRRRLPPCGAAFAPGVFGGCGARRLGQFRLEPRGAEYLNPGRKAAAGERPGGIGGGGG